MTKHKEPPYPPGTEFTFRTVTRQAEAFNGRRCRVVRKLDDVTEVDEEEVGRMYRVAFDDGKPGTEVDAFEDELQ